MKPGLELYRLCANPNCNQYFLVKTTSVRNKYCCPNVQTQLLREITENAKGKATIENTSAHRYDTMTEVLQFILNWFEEVHHYSQLKLFLLIQLMLLCFFEFPV